MRVNKLGLRFNCGHLSSAHSTSKLFGTSRKETEGGEREREWEGPNAAAVQLLQLDWMQQTSVCVCMCVWMSARESERERECRSNDKHDKEGEQICK